MAKREPIEMLLKERLGVTICVRLDASTADKLQHRVGTYNTKRGRGKPKLTVSDLVRIIISTHLDT